MPISPGEATLILTGGLIPEGTEAIVREEHTSNYEGADSWPPPIRASIHYLEMAEDLNRPPRNRYSFRRRGATAR